MRSDKICFLHGIYLSFFSMNMRFFSPCDQSVFETLPLELFEFSLQNKLKYYNERRFHESLYSLTPKDVYLGQGEKIKNTRRAFRMFGKKGDSFYTSYSFKRYKGIKEDISRNYQFPATGTH